MERRTTRTGAVGICVPTLNAGAGWPAWLKRLQPLIGTVRLLVVDSSSDDETLALARQAGAETHVISRGAFDHGGTRDWALRHLDDCDIVIFLTQDALPLDTGSLTTLVECFADPTVGAAFGRQLPHEEASCIATHARLFNYPDESRRVSRADIPRLGIKAAFLSNSFAAYRRQALMAAGGFPQGTILSEDMIAGARLLKAGWKLSYCAEAQVRHSHNYTLAEEFRRYFDIGVLHQREAWLLEWLGSAEGEGVRFVRSEARYLLKNAPWRLPEAGVRTVLKYAGYRLGKLESHLPLSLRRRFSMHSGYWNKPG